MNPMLMKYLLGAPWQQDEVAPPMADPSAPPPVPQAWAQGASVAPEAPPPQPQQFDIREYFKAMRPELFSQGAVDSALESDATTNARNAGLRRMESGAAGYGLRNPNYAGMEPTEAGMRGLQARQQQALQSAEVGSKVGQYMQSVDAGDPTSGASLRAYAAAMTDPEIAERVAKLGRLGQVSASQIEQVKAFGKEGAGIYKDRAAGRSSASEADTKDALRPGLVAAQPVELEGKVLANKDAALKPALTQSQIDQNRAGTAKTVAETGQIGVAAAPQQFDVDFTPPTIKAPDGVVNPIVAAAGDARASLGMIKELKALTAPGVPIAGPTKARVDQLVTSLQMKLKNIYGLGVLNKSDMDLLDRVVKSPTGVVAWLQSGTGLRDFARMLDGLETDTKTGIRARAQGIGSAPRPGSIFAEGAAPPPDAPKTDPLGVR